MNTVQRGVREFRLPDVGEGLVDAEILQWFVQPGDEVAINQVICEIETAKAAVELPSPYAGTVHAVLVEAGRTVDVGTPIISVDDGTGGDTVGEPEEVREKPLVGYGEKAASTRRRPRRRPGASATGDAERGGGAAAQAGDAASERAQQPVPEAPALVRRSAPEAPAAPVASAPSAAPVAAVNGGAVTVLAKPPVRKLAKDLGVDLRSVAPTGKGGVITRDDVQRAAEPAAPPAAEEAPAAPEPVGAPATGARETRTPIKGVRKHTAAAMVHSAFTAPHATEFLQVDVTKTMKAVRKLRERPEFAGLKVSPLLLVARALLTAVRRYPEVNASWDDDAQEIVVKHYVNLGIAAATERGLVVPNIKDAHAKALPQLAADLQELTATARAGRTAPADMSGGTITVTNIGVFGVDAGTPILNPGEAAILACGQIRDLPWVHKGELAVRKVTTLSLSFDHRLVDGELGSKVLRDVGAMLEDPKTTALIWG
ncbi:dihydrolipoamide acetyltransferase family protein [Nocardiopsis sediminis]|uniref:Dihydrolipoamide acetyltransferase component of pyruvate dehydrogenase complex n=1 Tax=Nocardiopsis sediminis TaxID=1778267 RepID=A0ABV8FQC4_9ACTN